MAAKKVSEESVEGGVGCEGGCGNAGS